MDKEKDFNKRPTRSIPTRRGFYLPLPLRQRRKTLVTRQALPLEGKAIHANSQHDKRIFPSSVTAVMATDDASISQAVCDCGSEHQGTSTRRCPVFNIVGVLHQQVYELLSILDFLEFGKNGAMAHCLRSGALRSYNRGIYAFQKWQAKSEENPSWNLADPISRLRRYFDQISITCAEDKRTLGPHPSPSILPVIVDDEEKTLKKAKEAVVELYDCCANFIWEHGTCPDMPVGPDNDPERWLEQIDLTFEGAMDAINSIDKAEDATLQDLSNKSYRIWRETRRLMCEYERPFASVRVIPGDM